MIVLVCGGRDYADRDRVFATLDDVHAVDGPITVLVHGACGWDCSRPTMYRVDRLRGADGLADEWARESGVLVKRVAADWSQGRRAGPIRNMQMIKMQPHLVVAFPGGSGTADMVERARAAGVPVREVV